MDISPNKKYIISLSKRLVSDLSKEEVVELIGVLSQYLTCGRFYETPLERDEKSIRSFGDSYKIKRDEINDKFQTVADKIQTNDDNKTYRMKMTANKIISRQCGLDNGHDSKDTWTDDCLRNMSSIINRPTLKSTMKIFIDENNETCSSKVTSNEAFTSHNCNNTNNKPYKLRSSYLSNSSINTDKIDKTTFDIQKSEDFNPNKIIIPNIIINEKQISDCERYKKLLFMKNLFDPILSKSNQKDQKNIFTASNGSFEKLCRSQDICNISKILSKYERQRKILKVNVNIQKHLTSQRGFSHESSLQRNSRNCNSNGLTKSDSINSFQQKRKSVNFNVSDTKYESVKNSKNSICKICHLQFSAKKAMSLHQCKTHFHI